MPPFYRMGRAGEYLAASWLIRQLDEIYEASAPSRYDFLCTDKEFSYKIQVKTTSSLFEHHSSEWARWDINKKVNKTKKVYSQDEVDIFGFVYLPLNIVEFVPNYKLGKTYQKKIEYLKDVDTLKSLRRSTTIINEIT